MGYRSGILATRALAQASGADGADGADGEAAFLALARSPDFEPAALPAFARIHKLREWFTPLVDSPEARSLLPADFVADLEAVRAAQPGRKGALLALCEQVRDAFGAAGIDHLFLKGLYLGQRFYGDVHRRHQWDVDVLVRPADGEKVAGTLAGLGFDLTAGRARRNLARLRAGQRPQTLPVRRGDGLVVDVHFRTKSLWFPGIDEEAYWARRQGFSIEGRDFETLSDEDTLRLLIASLGADLRRGAVRCKHFLDLYLVLRALGPEWDWDRFLEARGRERLGRASASVLAVFLALWGCAGELPELAAALERRRRWVELRDAAEALALATRPRRSPANHRWYERLGSRSRAGYWRLRLGRDLPHTVGRSLAALRRPGAVPWEPPLTPPLPGPHAGAGGREASRS